MRGLPTQVIFNLQAVGIQQLFQSFPSFFSGESNFSNTLTIREIAGFDANGNPVDLARATDSSGIQFNTVRVISVPEPSSLVLFAIGAFFLYGRRILL